MTKNPRTMPTHAVESRSGAVVEVRPSGCRPFRLPVPQYLTMLRLHLPLIEPDGRFSRIRLSEKITHAFAYGRRCRLGAERTNPKS